MKIYKTNRGIFIESVGRLYAFGEKSWDEFLNQENLYETIRDEINASKNSQDIGFLNELTIHAPIQSQEIWAAGVTYTRSRDARMEESKDAGGGSFYDMVYDAVRPELFFKATAYRCVGPGDQVRIRKDSTWNVPEPELTLVINNKGKIIGYTIGNDMSSRSIEGENPLYLPQAKSYDGSAAIGPCVYVTEQPLPSDTLIQMQILRDQKTVFEGQVAISQIKRKFQDLVSYLYR